MGEARPRGAGSGGALQRTAAPSAADGWRAAGGEPAARDAAAAREAAGTRTPRVGVLGLQGDFACHRRTLEALGAEALRITLPADLETLDALVIPGGESTTMLRLLESTGLRAPLEAFVREKPVLGTCAGIVLLGHAAAPLPYPPLAVLDVTVERNAYGRQIDSFSDTVDAPVLGGPFDAVFIRAPRIRRVGEGVEVIARRGEEPVGVRSGRWVGLCFHPELTQDLRFHRWFLAEVAGLRLPAAGAKSGAQAPEGGPS